MRRGGIKSVAAASVGIAIAAATVARNPRSCLSLSTHTGNFDDLARLNAMGHHTRSPRWQGRQLDPTPVAAIRLIKAQSSP
jgi:hypothetical protein